MRLFNFLLSLAIFCGQGIVAQQSPLQSKGLLTGRIVDSEKGQPLEFATISVYSIDSVLTGGGITNAEGTFSIELSRGRYYAVIRFISFEDKVLENIEISSVSKKYNAGNIVLGANAKQLNEVEVTAQKSEMVINLDKKVFNVGQDLSNTGKSALDILDNIPSIAVDLDGNVSLRGSQNIQILVDGKPSGIANAENTEALQSIQGSMIERIEVVTNPSARYEAEGMGGIINIVLKKEQKSGINGSFELTTGYPDNHSFGANVNFRRAKINYFVNYTIRYRENPGSGNSFQHFMRTDTSYYTLIDRTRNRSGLSNQGRAGFDYFINPKNTLTAYFLINYQNQNNSSKIFYHDYLDNSEVLNVPGNLIGLTKRIDDESETRKNIEASLTWEKNFTKKDHKLVFISQYEDSKDQEDSEIAEKIAIVDQNNREAMEALTIEDEIEFPDSVLNQRSANGEGESNLLLQADYIYPFGKDGKFEAGYRSEFRTIKNPYSVSELNSQNIWQEIPGFSNDFKYHDDVHALYVQAGNNYNKFSLQLGLRAELSHVSTALKQTNEKSENEYLDFFPTIHSTYQLNPINSVQLSYSRRIQRPNFRMLNPFHSYSDSRNIQTGNPYLKPEYTNSMEAGYLMKRTVLNFYSGVYYRNTGNVIERVNIIDTLGITYITPINLSQRNAFGIESNITANVGKWWTLSGDVNFYRSITEGRYNGEDLNSDDYSWNTRLNSKMRFPAGVDFQTIFFYRAPEETTQGRREAFYMLNMGLSKDIFKNKGTLTLNIQDLLNSRRFRFELDKPELYAKEEFRWSKRSFSLSFVYRLNQKKKTGREGRGTNGGEGTEDMDF
jgi:outer membrane receptor protein involved in Fe transport